MLDVIQQLLTKLKQLLFTFFRLCCSLFFFFKMKRTKTDINRLTTLKLTPWTSTWFSAQQDSPGAAYAWRDHKHFPHHFCFFLFFLQYKKKPYKFNKKSFEIVLYQQKTSFVGVVDRKETEEMLKNS